MFGTTGRGGSVPLLRANLTTMAAIARASGGSGSLGTLDGVGDGLGDLGSAGDDEHAKFIQLRESVRGEVLLPGDVPAFQAAISTVWNANVRRRSPAAIVKVTCTRDIVTTVRFARRHEYRLAVRSAGAHSPWAIVDNAIVVDTSLMRGVFIDPRSRTCIAQPGCLIGDFDFATVQYNLASPCGVVSHVGLLGATLGGGIGFLSRMYGLSIDNVIEFEVVTADGNVIRVSNDEHEDLFWGMRGCGFNFGIVSSIHFRLHPIPTRFASGCIVYEWSKGRDVMMHYRDVLERNDHITPTEKSLRMTCHVIFMYTPDGRPVISLAPLYLSEDTDAGMQALEPLRQFQTPMIDTVRPMAYDELQRSNDDIAPTTCSWYETGPFLQDLTDDVIDIMIDRFERMPRECSRSTTFFLQQLGGSVKNFTDDDMAFQGREAKFWVGIVGGLDEARYPCESDYQQAYSKVKEWVNSTKDALAPFTVAHYVNSAETPQMVRESYSRHWSRLQKLKHTYDPDNFFNCNSNVKPASSSSD